MTPVPSGSKKPLLLLFPFEQLAHYLRCLTLAKNIAPYFEIRFAHSDRYAAFVAQEGFDTFACPGLDADVVLDCVKRFDFSWLRLESLEQAFKQQWQAIETYRPALVLGDTVLTLKMAAEIAGVPYASLMNGYLSPCYAGVRQMPRRHPLHPYFQHLPHAVRSALTRWGERKAFQQIHQPFRQLRRQYGLLKKGAYNEEIEGDLNLICDLPELFPQRALPASCQLIPPLLYTAHTTNEVLKKWDPAKKTLLVSMGSTGDWQQVRFLNDPRFQKYNIITAGDKATVVQGPTVTSLIFVNAQQLFPLVELVLCHGGNGTLYQALQAGIPLLCKTAHCEQEWNVQALEKLGLGASLDGLKSNAAHLKIVDNWMGRKGTEPLRRLQQQLAGPSAFGPVAERLLRLLPATKTIVPGTEVPSA